MENKLKLTVLVVEDEKGVRDLETNLLERMGFKVVTAISAEEGYGLVKQHHPDLILLDVMLSGKDGFSLAKKLHSMEETSRIPIIFVTAKDEPQDMIEGFAAGGRVYLTKPFTEKNLETAIRSILPPGE